MPLYWYFIFAEVALVLIIISLRTTRVEHVYVLSLPYHLSLIFHSLKTSSKEETHDFCFGVSVTKEVTPTHRNSG